METFLFYKKRNKTKENFTRFHQKLLKKIPIIKKFAEIIFPNPTI